MWMACWCSTSARSVLHLAQALQVPTQAVQAALYDSGLEAAHDNGTLDGPAYLAQLGELLGTTVEVAAWTAARRVPAILRRPCCNDCRPPANRGADQQRR